MVSGAPESGLPIDSVFHPTDLSEGSRLAFVHALRIALAAHARLTVFHVSTGDPTPHWGDFPKVRATLERWGELPPGSPREEVVRRGLDVEKISTSARDPVHAIDAYLGRNPAQLLVLATHGRGGLPRWLRGSVAEPVARSTQAITLFVPVGARAFVGPEDGRAKLDRVVIPVDRAPRAHPAIAVTSALARALGCGRTAFTVAHAGDEADMPELHLPDDPGWSWERVARPGRAVDTLMGVIRERVPDLVAMTTRGHRGFLDALRGSTTEQLVRRAPCPVLAVPAD